MPTTSRITPRCASATADDGPRPAAVGWWPRGWGEWLQVAMLAGILGGMVVPAIVHYWLGIQRLGGFWHCMKIFTGS